MDHSGFGSGRFSEVDRPIMGSQSTKKDWITGLRDYVNLMRERCPDETHPPEDWLAQGLSEISLNCGQSTAASSAPQGDVISVEDMRRTLADHSRRHTAIELQSRQIHLNQREKDRRFCG